jgi:Subtilisin inhibitor-like
VPPATRMLAAAPCTGAALALALAVLTACAGPGQGQGPAPTGGDDGGAAGGGTSQADDDLQVTVDRGDGSAPEEWTLSCGGSVEGSHPEAEAACAHLAGLEDPFTPLPVDVVCTEQYGGPQTAHVIGRWSGEEVDLELSRSDGCRIAQWDALGPFLPVPVGIEPTD